MLAVIVWIASKRSEAERKARHEREKAAGERILSVEADETKNSHGGGIVDLRDHFAKLGQERASTIDKLKSAARKDEPDKAS
jgi:hypothetical protein